jgi:hypothetical protein
MTENGVGGPGGIGTFGRRLLLAVDAKGYGGVDALTQSQFQEAILGLLGVAADKARLDRGEWVTQVGGDSIFAVLPEGASEPALVDTFMRTLDAELRAFNRNRVPSAWLRLRAAVHFGSASPGANGFIGRGPVEIGRILDSTALRGTLIAVPTACLAVGVSQTVFRDVVQEAFTTVGADEFRKVLIQEKEYRGPAWIWVPGSDVRHLDPGPDRTETTPSAAPGPAASNHDQRAGGQQPWRQTNIAHANATQFAVQGGNIVYHQPPAGSPRPAAADHDGQV